MGKNLPDNVKVLRSIIQHQEEINSINPHTFGDASSQGLLAAAYAITHQPLGILQGLVAAKSSITKKGVIITRFQPVAGHMATNLAGAQCKKCSTRTPDNQIPLLDGQHRCSPMDQRSIDYKQFVSN